VADRDEDVGQFFGYVEGDIMKVMIDEGVFEEVVVYDYQALCEIQSIASLTSAATRREEVFKKNTIFSTESC